MVRVVLVPTGSLAGLCLSSLARLLSKLWYRKPLLSHRFVNLLCRSQLICEQPQYTYQLWTRVIVWRENMLGKPTGSVQVALFAQVVDSWWDIVGLTSSSTFRFRFDRTSYSHKWLNFLPFFTNSDSHVLGVVTISSCWVQCSLGNSLDSCNKNLSPGWKNNLMFCIIQLTPCSSWGRDPVHNLYTGQ